MNIIKTLGLIICLSASIILSGTARAVDYDIVDLGTLGGNIGIAHDINDNRRIVGWSFIDSTYYHAFSFNNEVMSEIAPSRL